MLSPVTPDFHLFPSRIILPFCTACYVFPMEQQRKTAVITEQENESVFTVALKCQFNSTQIMLFSHSDGHFQCLSELARTRTH